jgi:hypothetical protein
MLQDFHFKIVHYAGVKHANIDALSKNQWVGMKLMKVLEMRFKTW